MVRIFRGGVLDERFEGSMVVIGPRPTQMTGLVRGDLFVRDNSLCEVLGFVTGSLVAERTGRAILKGMVAKDVKTVGGEVVVEGLVVGNVVNESGAIYIDKGSLIKGQVQGDIRAEPLPPFEPARPGPSSGAAAKPKP